MSPRAQTYRPGTPSLPHLVFVGLPGSGKTTLGRAVAAALGLEFLDFDEEIERRSGLTPSEYFRLRGEPAFRAEELALSKELAQRHSIVVAPGGGWITQPGARAAIGPRVRIVYLRVSAATAAERLGEAAQARPLLAGDPAAELERLLASRRELYESADETVDTEAIGMKQLTEQLVALARRLLQETG